MEPNPDISMFNIALAALVFAIVFFCLFLNEMIRNKKNQHKNKQLTARISTINTWAKLHQNGRVSDDDFNQRIINITSQ